MATYTSNTTMAISGSGFDTDRSSTGSVLSNQTAGRMCKGNLYVSIEQGGGGNVTATLTVDGSIVGYIHSDMNQHPNFIGVNSRVNETFTDFVLGPLQELTVTFSGVGTFYCGYTGVYLTNTP